MPLVDTPEPPYTVVVFSSIRTEGDQGYAATAARMAALAREQPGFLAFESVPAHAPGEVGITTSYWADDDAARAWKLVQEHAVAQERGRSTWYTDYRVRVATVTRAYGPS